MLASAGLDPLYHAYSEGDLLEIECQFCNNEIADGDKLKSLEDKVFLSTPLKIRTIESFFSINLKNVQARAPPTTKIS